VVPDAVMDTVALAPRTARLLLPTPDADSVADPTVMLTVVDDPDDVSCTFAALVPDAVRVDDPMERVTDDMVVADSHTLPPLVHVSEALPLMDTETPVTTVAPLTSTLLPLAEVRDADEPMLTPSVVTCELSTIPLPADDSDVDDPSTTIDTPVATPPTPMEGPTLWVQLEAPTTDVVTDVAAPTMLTPKPPLMVTAVLVMETEDAEAIRALPYAAPAVHVTLDARIVELLNVDPWMSMLYRDATHTADVTAEMELVAISAVTMLLPPLLVRDDEAPTAIVHSDAVPLANEMHAPAEERTEAPVILISNDEALVPITTPPREVA
jgi:hypothetical protein